jgi:hypothetical protein
MPEGNIEQQFENTGKRSSWLARHEWTVVGLIALACFIMGAHGYYQTMHFEVAGGNHTWWDPIYASLQLFIFEGPDETGGWPLHLQVARALAPIVLLYTAAVAIFQQVETRVALYRLLFHKRRFVVICGIGDTGFRIARDYCMHSKKKVVVIDINPMNPMAAELANHGAIVIYGNAMDPVVLDKARVKYAKEVFLCTDDDQANISAAKNVERLCRSIKDKEIDRLARIARRNEPSIAGEPVSETLRAFLCVDAPDLYEVFSNHPFFEINTDRFAVRLFSRKETAARKIFSLCAPDLYYRPNSAEDPVLHVLFVGFEALARELILQTALTTHYPDYRLPHVTVMCQEDCSELVARFFHRHPTLKHTLTIDIVYSDPLTVTAQEWTDLQKRMSFSVAYVSMQKDVEGILAGRRLSRLNRLEGMDLLNFVVCLNQNTFLAEIIDDDFVPITLDKSRLPAHSAIEYFETLDETISIDVIVNEALDGLARTLHNAYLDTLLMRGETRKNNASLIPWSELPAHKKKANQHAAAHMDVKLRASGCIAVPVHVAAQTQHFPLDSDNLEMLAQLEHRRWMADKFLAGYSYGPERDEDRMLHPDLIPWEELTEADKEKDRDNIRQIPELLALLGMKICRPEDVAAGVLRNE